MTRETPDLRAALAAWLRSRPNDAEAETQLVLAAREWLDEATPEPAPPCRCGHPFSDHRTPGTECAVIGCHCEPYEPAPAVLDVERLARALVPFTRAVLHDDVDKWRRETAEKIAAAYAALTATSSEATDG